MIYKVLLDCSIHHLCLLMVLSRKPTLSDFTFCPSRGWSLIHRSRSRHTWSSKLVDRYIESLEEGRGVVTRPCYH